MEVSSEQYRVDFTLNLGPILASIHLYLVHVHLGICNILGGILALPVQKFTPLRCVHFISKKVLQITTRSVGALRRRSTTELGVFAQNAHVPYFPLITRAQLVADNRCPQREKLVGNG